MSKKPKLDSPLIKGTDSPSSVKSYSSDSNSLGLPSQPQYLAITQPLLSSFKDLVKTCTFSPLNGVRVTASVLEEQANEDFPIERCTACEKRVDESEILKCIGDVKWWMIDTSTYDLKEVDERLYELVTAVRGGIRCNFANGQAKMVSTCLISVIRSTLCAEHNLSLNVVSPTECSEDGGINVKLVVIKKECEELEGSDEEATSSTWKTEKTTTVAGKPDISVYVADEPHFFVLISENKKGKSKKRQYSWHDRSKDDSELGQLLYYLLGAHMRRLQFLKYNKLVQKRRPILGLFMAGDKMQTVVADIKHRGGNDWALTFFVSGQLHYADGGLAKTVQVARLFLSVL